MNDTTLRARTTLPLRIRSASAVELAAEPTHVVWLSVQQAADHIGVSDKTIRRRIDEGVLRAERFGPKLLRIDLAVLNAFCTPAHPVWVP